MAQIRLVERMTEVPAACLCCGKGNVPDNSGQIQPAVDLGADVNWGDSTYICNDCATIVGSLVGMLTLDEKKELENRIKRLKKKLHDAQATIESKRMVERQAVRRARAVEAIGQES